MATKTFYLSLKADYDYSHANQLIEIRKNILDLLRSNGYMVNFINLDNSELFLHNENGQQETLVRCNNCGAEWDEDAPLIKVGEETFHGCPYCKTDAYLIDIK